MKSLKEELDNFDFDSIEGYDDEPLYDKSEFDTTEAEEGFDSIPEEGDEYTANGFSVVDNLDDLVDSWRAESEGAGAVEPKDSVDEKELTDEELQNEEDAYFGESIESLNKTEKRLVETLRKVRAQKASLLKK